MDKTEAPSHVNNTRSGNTRAENTGDGTQALHVGDGSQNVFIGANSSQYNRTWYRIRNAPLSLPDVLHLRATTVILPSQSDIESLLGGREEQEPSRATIIKWLLIKSSLEFLNHHRMLLGQLVTGTGQWVLESSTFQEWKDPMSSSSRLWMHGNRE